MKSPSELELYRERYGIISREWYVDEEEDRLRRMVEDGKQLPENVFQDGNDFFELINHGYSREDIIEILKYKQLGLMREQSAKIDTIKKCVLFFVVITAISLLVSFVSFSQLLNML